tara:strand:- start:581 stop:1252 length:672 start_codon:yes stop_codon:yes gene_type:complete
LNPEKSTGTLIDPTKITHKTQGSEMDFDSSILAKIVGGGAFFSFVTFIINIIYSKIVSWREVQKIYDVFLEEVFFTYTLLNKALPNVEAENKNDLFPAFRSLVANRGLFINNFQDNFYGSINKLGKQKISSIINYSSMIKSFQIGCDLFSDLLQKKRTPDEKNKFSVLSAQLYIDAKNIHQTLEIFLLHNGYKTRINKQNSEKGSDIEKMKNIREMRNKNPES